MAAPSTDLLRRVPFLAHLDQAEAEALAAEFVERAYAPGEVITGQGQEGLSFFLVESGEAVVVRQGEEAGRLGPGASFGELALFDADARRAATVTAASQMRCWSLPIWSFRAFVEGRPAVAWALLEQLAAQIRELQDR